MAGGDTYRELAKVCKRRQLRLLLCGDTHRAPLRLTTIDILKGSELRVRVSIRDLTLDAAAASALNALEQEAKR